MLLVSVRERVLGGGEGGLEVVRRAGQQSVGFLKQNIICWADAAATTAASHKSIIIPAARNLRFKQPLPLQWLDRQHIGLNNVEF